MFVVYFLLWVIFNGRFTWEIAAFGVAISGVLYWFTCKVFDYSPRKDWQILRSIGLLLLYVGTLIWEIIKANFDVMRLILSPKYEIQPKLVSFRTSLKEELGKVVLANSITLTPGTITVTLEEDRYCVHCLDEDFSEGLQDSVFTEQLQKLETVMMGAKLRKKETVPQDTEESEG